MPYPLQHLLVPVFGYLNGKRGRKFFYLPNYGQKISQGPEYKPPQQAKPAPNPNVSPTPKPVGGDQPATAKPAIPISPTTQPQPIERPTPNIEPKQPKDPGLDYLNQTKPPKPTREMTKQEYDEYVAGLPKPPNSSKPPEQEFEPYKEWNPEEEVEEPGNTNGGGEGEPAENLEIGDDDEDYSEAERQLIDDMKKSGLNRRAEWLYDLLPQVGERIDGFDTLAEFEDYVVEAVDNQADDRGYEEWKGERSSLFEVARRWAQAEWRRVHRQEDRGESMEGRDRGFGDAQDIEIGEDLEQRIEDDEELMEQSTQEMLSGLRQGHDEKSTISKWAKTWAMMMLPSEFPNLSEFTEFVVNSLLKEGDGANLSPEQLTLVQQAASYWAKERWEKGNPEGWEDIEQ